MTDKKTSITLTMAALVGVVLGLFVFHDMKMALPSLFFFGYFLRDVSAQPRKR
jgi:hypothetical protein